MQIVAILAVRNERPYLGNCLKHLIDNGISYAVIDDQSTDDTVELLRSEQFAAHLVAYEAYPSTGRFSWKGLLEAKHALGERLAADWLIHLDGDEICIRGRASHYRRRSRAWTDRATK